MKDKLLNGVKGIFNPIKGLFTSSKISDSGETEISEEKFLKKYQKLFSTKIKKDVVLLAEDILCAKIAHISYIPSKERPEVIDGHHYNPNISTENSAIYVNGETKIVVFGIRGTVVSDIKDLISDIQIVFGIQNIDPRVGEVLNMYDTLRRKFQGYSIRVCGHSLGGTLSYIIGKHRNPGRCTVFNPGASINTLFLHMLQDTLTKKERTKKTYTYKILGDLISSIAFIGNTTTFTIKATDPLQLHTVDNFVNLNQS